MKKSGKGRSKPWKGRGVANLGRRRGGDDLGQTVKGAAIGKLRKVEGRGQRLTRGGGGGGGGGLRMTYIPFYSLLL